AQLAPNVLVSTASDPARKYASCTPRTTSGRDTLRISLQPSSPRKSSTVSSAACNMVPIAPSATTPRPRDAANRDVDEVGMAPRLPSPGARYTPPLHSEERSLRYRPGDRSERNPGRDEHLREEAGQLARTRTDTSGRDSRRS